MGKSWRNKHAFQGISTVFHQNDRTCCTSSGCEWCPMAKVDRSRPQRVVSSRGYVDKESHVKQVLREPSDQPQAIGCLARPTRAKWVKQTILGQVDWVVTFQRCQGGIGGRFCHSTGIFSSQKKWSAAPLQLQLHKSTWIGPTWIQPVVWFWAKSEIGCSRLTSGCGLPIELLDLTPNFYITVLFYGIMDQKQHWKSVECDVNSTIYIHLFHHGFHWNRTFWEKSGHTCSSQFVLTQSLNASLPNQPLVPCQHRVICGGFWQKNKNLHYLSDLYNHLLLTTKSKKCSSTKKGLKNFDWPCHFPPGFRCVCVRVFLFI